MGTLSLPVLGLAQEQLQSLQATNLNEMALIQAPPTAVSPESLSAIERVQTPLEVHPAMSLSDFSPPQPGIPRLDVPMGEGVFAHILPGSQRRAALVKAAFDNGPLLYHRGGVIMPSATFYAIFWVPASGRLQNGKPTSMTANYANAQLGLLNDYPGHGIGNVTTQYGQIAGSRVTFPSNSGGLGGFAVDTSPFPASGCTDSATPGNCISDAQIRAEIKKVMAAKGWTGGLNKMFLLFTSSGEGSCLAPGECYGPGGYCAYHSFVPGSAPIIYGNEPFGDPSGCLGSAGSPSGDPATEATLTAASHEISEAITDPLPGVGTGAWRSAQGSEIGDLCAYNYGANTWSASANQWWNGRLYELQTEFDNHAYFFGYGGCQQVGPL